MQMTVQDRRRKVNPPLPDTQDLAAALVAETVGAVRDMQRLGERGRELAALTDPSGPAAAIYALGQTAGRETGHDPRRADDALVVMASGTDRIAAVMGRLDAAGLAGTCLMDQCKLLVRTEAHLSDRGADRARQIAGQAALAFALQVMGAELAGRRGVQ